jgi:integrase
MPSRIPSYRLHKPSGQAVVTLSGRDRYLGRHGSPESRAAYERAVAEWLAERRRPAETAPPPSALTVNELLLAYWDFARAYYVKDGQPTSEPDTIRQALRPVRELYGDARAVDFGPLALKAVRQAMIARGWCRGFVNKQVNRVRRTFAWAAAEELVPLATYQALATLPGLRRGRSEAREKPPVGPVPDELVERTLPLLPPTVAAMVRLQRLTGMRPQEVVLMRAGDVDRSDPACWAYRPPRHKSQHHARERVVYLGPRARAILAPFLGLGLGPDDTLFSPRRAEQERRAGLRARRRTPLTPSQRERRPRSAPLRAPGELYDGGSYRKAIRRACLRLGVPIWFPHQLRHSAATEVRRRYGLEASQAVLGHRELGTTQIYAEVDGSAARRVMAEIG